MFELVGVQKINFKDDTGKSISGTKIHFIMDADPDQKANGFIGKIAASKFFNSNAQIPTPLQCGKHYEFIMSYNGGTAPRLLGFKPVNA